MKNLIGIIGIVLLSTVFFLSNASIKNDDSLNMASLLSFNKVNAEGGGSHTCYDTLVYGNVYYVVNCSGCKAQRTAQMLDPNKCG